MIVKIIDIDGTICNSVFPNFNNLSELLDLQIYKELILKQSLYSNFIKYYNYIIEKYENIKFFFVTGRQKSVFLNETLKQLNSDITLKTGRDFITFINIESEYTFEDYINYKIDVISHIIKKHYFNHNKIQCFDDISNYYDDLRKIFPNVKYTVIHLYDLITHKKNDIEDFWRKELKMELI